MDVSVVIPTRNRRPLLAMTLRSVLRQQDVDCEVIVVDEASSDGTPQMVASLADCRIRIIRHEQPMGVATARNHGATEARGEWLAFLDDDDLWAPDKLALQLRAAQEARRDWAYSGAVLIDDQNRFLGAQHPLSPEHVIASLPRYDAIPGGGSNVIVRRGAWQETGPFDARLRNTEDWEMWIRLAKYAVPVCVNKPSVARRVHRTNSILDVAELTRGTKLIESLHQTRADWGRLHLWMAQSCLRSGRRGAAVAQFAKAALHGEGAGVVRHIRADLRARLAARFPTLRIDDTLVDDPWRVAACQWLQELRSQTGTGDDQK
jgi:GT2 family glycosyltransferase